MALVDMRDMLNHAYTNRYAVGGFDLVSLDFLEAIIDAAERCRSPVILSLAESHFDYYDFELAMAAAEAAAHRASVPVALHLDHGATFESAVRAIKLGCNGVMVDASHEPFPANVALTRRVTAMAHACGIAVEGELGYVAGVEGEDADRHPGEVVYTSVEEARAYVERTEVDCLAVSIGTVHGRLRGRPKLDIRRLEQINAAVGVPLVIHGGTGLSDDQFHKLIVHGVAKINYYTALADAAGERIRANALADGGCGYTGLVKGIRQAMGEEVERCMRLWGSAGRAAEVATQCRPIERVEHVVLYNVELKGETHVETLMARGREVLAQIPGVRRVVTGWTEAAQPRYRFCWLIELASRAAIETYRHHPLHLEFADQIFRPVAGDRVTADYVCRDPGARVPDTARVSPLCAPR